MFSEFLSVSARVSKVLMQFEIGDREKMGDRSRSGTLRAIGIGIDSSPFNRIWKLPLQRATENQGDPT